VEGRTRLLLPRDRAALLLAVLWLTSILPADRSTQAGHAMTQLNQLGWQEWIDG
jgi:hypothetical protein